MQQQIAATERSKTVMILVPPSMRRQLERAAAANERSVGGEVRVALREHLAHAGKEER